MTKETGHLLYRSEVKALRRLPEHRNLPRLIGSCKTKFTANIVMSYYPHPTLFRYLEKHGAMSSADAIFVLRQLVISSSFTQFHARLCLTKLMLGGDGRGAHAARRGPS